MVAVRAEPVTSSTERNEIGWPSEMLFLLERHPRSSWPSASSPSVAFWLEVHARLRRDCAGLGLASEDYAGGRSSAEQLAVIAAPRLHGLVAGLGGHHQIEDYHYFPAFRRQEPRLAAGFERLEREHAALASGVDAALTALAELRAAAGARDALALRLAADRYVETAERLCNALHRHFDDEEALVVPLLLEHEAH
jgi:hypothetical protein